MKAFVLAAGFGERLRPITDDMPKALIPVLNLPSICYALFLLKEAGITDAVCNLHYRGEQIVDYLRSKKNFGMDLTFSHEEKILGTGGGLKKCQDYFDEDFILINTDIILDVDLDSLIEVHRRSAHPATLLLHDTDKADQIGPVEVDGDRVKGFQGRSADEPVSSLIYTGAAMLSTKVFDYLTLTFSSVVNTAFEGLISDLSLGHTVHRGFWYDIGNMTDYWETNIRHHRDVLGLKARIEDVLGESPHLISSQSRIASSAVVKKSVIARDAKIGSGVRVEESVILPGSVVKRDTAVRRSVTYPGGVIVMSEN